MKLYKEKLDPSARLAEFGKLLGFVGNGGEGDDGGGGDKSNPFGGLYMVSRGGGAIKQKTKKNYMIVMQ